MCHEPDARTPLPPISGASDLARSADIVLRSSDGTEFAAFEAMTSHDAAPGIVILPDVRGLHPFYRDLAMRSAEAGMHAIAIDYFGRTAGPAKRRDDFEYMPHVEQTAEETVQADVRAAVTEPIMTLAFIKTGMRAASFVTQIRMFPSFMNRPLNGMIARIRTVSTSPSGVFIRSVPSTRSSRR